MGYTALDQMRRENQRRYGRSAGPFVPPPARDIRNGCSLKAAALRFLRERCEGLRFSEGKAEEEKRTGQYLGTSLRPRQIPYNMQMDIDRLCLEKELEHFIDSGVAEDAYTVYYSWLEMFLGEYGRSQEMVEMLSEFESNASSLLMKHRDHYSHSVYVFTLGLAYYETNEDFRRIFNTRYGFAQDGAQAAAFFLEYWGLTSLFHDIGYPFEIPFEQVLAYFEMDQKTRGPGSVFISYRDLEALVSLGDAARRRLEDLFGRSFADLNELIAFGIADTLGEAYGISEESLRKTLSEKPTRPDHFGYFMDHAYFSATRLYQELVEELGADRLTAAHLDALSAIALHNSLYKFSIAFYKSPEKKKPPLKADLHPLAWLLMLCDELQCWDRTAYGRNSRTELHPMAASFDFSGGGIRAVYVFDQDEKEKIGDYEACYSLWEEGGRQGKPPRLKAYSDMAEKEQRFRTDIESIVDLNGTAFSVETMLRKPDRSLKHTYLSRSNFLHIYDFAMALNARYSYQGQEERIPTRQLEHEFDSLSLEYKLSNINQVKSFARYLDAIGCFYTDRPVDYRLLDRFTSAQTAVFAPMEHERWVREHRSHGWTCSRLYENPSLSREEQAALREQLRQHALCMNSWRSAADIHRHYHCLSAADQGKDWKPYNSMLKLIKKYDGLRIYSLR